MKDDQSPEQKSDLRPDPAVEERVRRMMEPTAPTEKTDKPVFEVIKEDTEVPGPPELGSADELPVKIELRDEPPAKDQSLPEPVVMPAAAPFEDPATDHAVDDILKSESDELLKAKDEEITKAFDDKKPGFGQRLKAAISDFWHDKRRRRIALSLIALLIAVIGAVPSSRYLLLNSFGVRGSASVTVLDQSTRQPLRNVTVTLHDQTVQTDQDGRAAFSRLKLGQTELKIEKRAFAVVTRKLALGWGSNPLGVVDLTPQGLQYSFKVTDFVSGQPVGKVEAVSGEYSAYSDEQGVIKLTVDETDDQNRPVSIKKDQYREENFELPDDYKTEHQVVLAPAKKHVFISKRSGKYDVYSIYADGKTEELILAGTGNEREDIVLVPHPTEPLVALVSTRENERNSDGFLLSSLTLIDMGQQNAVTEIAQSERLQIVDWLGDRLVYVRIAAGASADKPDRHRLVSYDYKTLEYTELAQSNHFNDVLTVGDYIYYAPSSAYQKQPVAMRRVKADGSDSSAILDKETWNIFRTDYDTLTLAVGQDWYSYDLSDNSHFQLEGEPADLSSRVYTNSFDRQKSLWVDERDGKGVLVMYDSQSREDKALHSRSGLKTPVRWLSDSTILFRVKTDTETADYVISLNGGEPKKVADVTDTSGIDRWYYY